MTIPQIVFSLYFALLEPISPWYWEDYRGKREDIKKNGREV